MSRRSLILIFVVWSAATLLAYWWIKPRAQAFNASAWQADADSFRGGSRWQMADDLIAKKALLGMTRAKVVSLLGTPTSDNFPEWDCAYWLGPNGIDDWWLALRFDANDCVVESRIVPD